MKYSFNMKPSDIDAGTVATGKSAVTIADNIQKMAVSILVAWQACGDRETAVKQANSLVNALGKGMRKASLQTWFIKNSPVMIGEGEVSKGLLVFGVSGASAVKDFKSIPVAGLALDLWVEAKKEQEVTPIQDWTKFINIVLNKAKKDLTTFGDKSKVNKEQLAVMERMIAA